MIINFTLGGNGGGGGSDPSKLDITTFNQFVQDQNIIDENQNLVIENIDSNVQMMNVRFGDVYDKISETNGAVMDVNMRVDTLEDKVEEIQLFKFPNATIIGEPTIQNGQISGFSTMSYLQFPFILDLHNQNFQIDFCFTTATNVQQQQNILDSKFGLALAISGGKGLMAISSNGTDWNIGSIQGSMNIESNTTYYARLTWDGIQYKTFLSTDGTNYTQDMVLVGTQAPHPTTIFIGGCDTLETGHAPHPFLGTINLNKASLTVRGNIVWEGMDDVGLATRLATDMSNLDENGAKVINDMITNKITATFDFDAETGTLNIITEG